MGSIEQHVVVAKQLANELEQTKSTEVFNQMESEHIQAVQEHIEATNDFLKSSKQRKHPKRRSSS